MAAAAGAAALGMAVVGEPADTGAAAVVLLMAVAGGIVEGLAVGLLQHRVLRTWLPDLSRAKYVGGTVALAAAFWLLGMLPSTLLALAPEEGGPPQDDPSMVMIVAISALGGALGGVAFGVVQGWAMRGHVPHPWRWIRPNAIGWALAVAVITVGASSAPAGIAPLALVGYGALVGLLAGACVGAVTAQAIPSLALALPWWNRVVVDLLLSPLHGLLSGSVVLLRFVGRRSGATVTVPVQYALRDGTVTVYVAQADTKRWWRSFADGPRPVHLVLRGRRLAGHGALPAAGTPAHEAAAAAYRGRWPRVAVAGDAVLLEIEPVADSVPAAPGALVEQ
jgi:hypothetical protein